MTKRILSVLLIWTILLVPALSVSSGAADVLAAPKIVGVQVRAEADFTAYFYLESSSSLATEIGVLVGDLRVPAEKLEDGRYVAVLEGLSATKMADLAIVTPYATSASGTAARGSKLLFGLQDYAARLLARPDTDEAARNMLIAMLNYGAACQKLRGYRTHMPANSILLEDERVIPVRPFQSIVVPPEFEEGDIRYSVNAAVLYTDRVVFSFDFEMEGFSDESGVYMEIADNPAFEDASRYALEKTSPANTDEQSPAIYNTQTDGIYLNCLSKTYYVRLVTAEGASRSFAYSAESYVHLVLETELGNGMGSTVRNYFRAMMALGDALCAYEKSL